MMITKRQFLVTMLIFLILLLLFMGFQVGKEAVYSADRNQPVTGISIDPGAAGRSTDVFLTPEAAETAAQPLPDKWVLYLGREDSSYAGTVREWAYDTQTPVVLSGELPAEGSPDLPDLLLIEPEFVSGRSEQIARLMEQGVDAVFLALPDCGDVEADAALQKILGIHAILRPEIELRGIHLFQGFLLGGERIFAAGDGEDAEKQDLDLLVPWYSVRTGTKTFMRGILSEADSSRARDSELEDEDMPALIWRNHFGSGEAYAVNGRYMENRKIGIGVLQAMMYERAEYFLYPVINAQLFSVANFPMLTDENQEQVLPVYGRSVTKMQTDIIMPMMIKLAAKHHFQPSCFMSVKYDMDDAAQPDTAALKTYLPMLGEMDGELCLSSDYRGASTAAGKAQYDRNALDAAGLDYRIASVLSPCSGLSSLPDELRQAGLTEIQTVSTSDESDEYPIVGFLEGNIVCLQSTSDLTRHTFTDELETLGVQTLLAYSNGSYDMASTFYSDNVEDEWQNASRRIISNLTTYTEPFHAVDRLTAAESDARVRTYFALRYDAVRSGDDISVTVSNDAGTDACYFILRTHGETVESVEGGTFVELEKNAYLISAGGETLRVHLASTLSALVNMEGSNR